MFCTKCGKELPDSAKFCTNCGASLKSRAGEAAPKEHPAADLATANPAKAPEVEQETPEIERVAPAAGQDPPEIEQEAPATEQTLPKIEQEDSEVWQMDPAIWQDSPAAEQEAPKAKKKPKSKKKLVIILSVVGCLAVVALCVGGYFGLQAMKTAKEFNENMNQAAEYIADQEYEKAIKKYKAAQELRPNDESITLALADAYMMCEEYNKAKQTYQDYLEIDPDHEQAVLGLASAHRYLGDYDKALKTLEPLLNKSKVNVEALLIHGEICVIQEDYDKAIESFQAILETDVDNPDTKEVALNSMGDIYLWGEDYDKAIESYQKLLDTAPENTHALLGKAEAQLYTGEFQAAEATLKAVNKAEPDVDSDRLGRLQRVASLRPEVESLDSISDVPEVSLVISLNGDCEIDDVTVEENGADRSADWYHYDYDEIAVSYTTNRATSEGDERKVVVTLIVDGYPISLTTSYEAFYGSALLKQFAGEYVSTDVRYENYYCLGVRLSAEYTGGDLSVRSWAGSLDDDDWEWFDTYIYGDEMIGYKNYEYYDYYDLNVEFVPADDSEYGSDTIKVSYHGEFYDFVRQDSEAHISALTQGNGFVLPTDYYYISREDLQNLSKDEILYARNEIYARYGYTFQSDDLKDYFNAKNWYWPDPDVNASTFGLDDMNDYERANLETIIAYETAMGWR